jgi:L-lactate dehydrogenase (cytochrome)
MKASPPQTNAEYESPEKKALPLSLCMNLDDVEMSACRVMSRRAVTFITSGADTLATVQRNRKDWSKVFFRPRVLRNVTRADMRRNILGKESSLPFFIAPMGMAKLAYTEGESTLVHGAVAKNFPYCVSGYSSIRHDELMACQKEAGKGGFLFYQLYVAKAGEEATRQLIRNARNLGYEALFITVDAPVIGKREEDERYKAELDYAAGDAEEVQRTSQPTPNEGPPVLRGTHSYTLSWDDLAYIQEEWGASSGPVVIKGIQSAEDAKMAADLGFDGIYLSNHGGRQLDYAPSSIRTLLEIRRFCPEILSQLQIFLDGGIRRGTDIVKALCLGATAVGIGRPYNYGIALAGLAGCNKVTQRRTFSTSAFIGF